MGNCFQRSQADDESDDHRSNFVNPTSSVLFTPGTSRVYSNGGGRSVSSSSPEQSQVSSATSDIAFLNGEILPTPNLRVYSYAELKRATENFKSDVLGAGAFGRVFQGWVDERTLVPSKPGSGMIVAIKKLDMESFHGYEEWQTEVSFLGRLSHPNLVRLLGYCWEDRELLLVYAFVPKGSLENHLFRRNAASEPLSWDVRLKIAIGSARGLAFLHSSERSIIHRDIKTSNILLDGNYNAKLADFGLAKLGPPDGKSHVSTRVVGTLGYAAPEYIATGHLFVKSDVYSFGVVLLEIVTGLRVFDKSRPRGQESLIDWIKPQLSNKRKLKSIMDARIQGQYSSKAVHLAALLTLKCLETEPKKRPAIREVVEVLEQVQAINEKAQRSRHGLLRSSPNRVGQSVGNRHRTSHSRA